MKWALFWIAGFFIFAGPIIAQDPDHAPIHVLDTPADFSGWVGPDIDPSGVDTVKIGFFMPDGIDDPVINAANLAISEINKSGGYHGKQIKLVQRWASDPWGAGSKEMIKLIYQDSVLAVIGSFDGETTHIAEQIVTKAWTPLVSPLSGDPTLNYINIPWMFRLPPDFKTQSEIIVKQGIINHGMQKIGLVTSNDHDGHIFSDNMLDVLKKESYTPLFHFEVPAQKFRIEETLAKVHDFEAQTLVLYLPPDIIMKVLSEIEKSNIHLSVCIPWIPGFEIEKVEKLDLKNVFYVAPFDTLENGKYRLFALRYAREFGYGPTARAAYTYDAVYVLAIALNSGGLNKVDLRDAIAHGAVWEGVTGKIIWDNGGGNQGKPVLRHIQNSY